MADDLTQTAISITEGKVASSAATAEALVLLWSREEPERVGEVALLGGVTPGTQVVLGRGNERRGTPRLELVRQRPDARIPTGSLASPRISREQLAITRTTAGALELTNVGKCRLRVRGEPVATPCTVAAGDLVELENEALFFVTTRPQTIGGPGMAFAHPFGVADPDGIVGESPAAWTLRERIAFIAGRDVHVLVRGPSGTGKELVVQAVHRRSARGRQPLVSRNAATIPESLVDAELFGHAKNFPNAGMPERQGLIGEADGSTLFLDEFAELPIALQSHLLRVLDQGEYVRLGEAKPRRAVFRLLAATNRPDAALKHDVLARFHLQLHVPGLGERREDVPLLARRLLDRILGRDPELARRFAGVRPGEGGLRMTARLVAALVTHDYTTHVRELESMLWQAMVHATGSTLDVWDDRVVPGRAPTATVPAIDAYEDDPPEREAPLHRETPAVDPLSIPAEVIQACLDRHDGRQEPAWRELGLASRHVLARLVRRHNLRVRGRAS